MSGVKAEDVSFYIPARNVARTLEAALASVAAQRVQPAEFLLVVDVRSDDGTVEVARRSGLRLVEQTAGRLGHARNLAIQACRTPWLASCDADVTLTPTWLERLLERADETVAAVGGRTLECLLTPADRWRAVNMPHNWGPAALDNPFMLVSEMLASVAALRSIGGYVPDLYYYDDSDACQRLRQAGFTLRYEPSAVAYHDRRDSVASVLKLRWLYAYQRQRSRLENLAGLTAKLAINRVYCLQSLSQTLHSEHADVCAISLLLWFHHAREDLMAALGRWPLLEQVERAACVARLDDVTTSCLDGTWGGLREPPRRLLSVSDGGSPAGGDGSLAGLAGFRDYLTAAREATRRVLGELPAPVVTAVLQSAARLVEGDEGPPFSPPRLAVRDEDERRLREQPLRSAWSWPALAEMLAAVVGSRLPVDSPILRGPAGAGEMPAAVVPAEVNADGRPRLVLVPHLETSARPEAELREALATADVAVVAYRTTEVFVPAVPLLTARDLATLCAGEGFRIRHFHTEAGLTRLIVERAEAAASQTKP